MFNGEKLELFIDGKGGKQFLGALTAPNQLIENQKELETLDKIIKIIKYFDFNGSIRADYNELYYLGDTIAPFYDLLHSPTANFTISFSIQDGEIDTSAPLIAIGSIKFRISNKLFIILYSTEGVPTKNDTEKKRKYILQGNLIKIEKKLVCDLKSVPSDDEILKALKLIETTFEDKLVVILNK